MQPVDLALCLAVDVSASVDFGEFGLMMGGLAAAWRDPGILAAATAGPRGAVAVALLQWSGPGAQAVGVDWQVVNGAAAANALAEAVDNCPRLLPPGATALGEGLVAGLAILGRFPAEASRLVLDVSGDGAGNTGRPSGPVRDLGVGAGVTINGLAVLNEEPDLLAHYEAEVIGGPGAFALSCADYNDFAEAIARKLAREIQGSLAV
ncbi:DUF1194 domain-containing protein [Roseomonas sp. BN140053]|uniref:DUF1194 domain-containing protein n=1 Tax=Roseomonas sp. BN140053 TaxID=3391898 RepID=UPI0039E8C453